MNKIIFRSLITLVISLLSSNVGRSQNDSKLSLFHYNPTFYNPGFAGSSDGLNIIGIYATQWYGFEGAPVTQFLSLDTKIEESKIGLGFNLFNDKAGPTREYSIEGNVAYYLNLNRRYKLALGLKAGYNANIVDFNLLKRLHPEEEIFGMGSIRNDSPEIGIGFNLYSDRFFIGASTPNLLGSKYYNPDYTYMIAKKKNYYYLTSGYKINLDLDFTLTPAILVRQTTGAPISVLTSFNLNWRKKYLSGINFEYNSSLGAYFAIKALENFNVGYAYDYSITKKFNNYNSGNHTFFISYSLENNNTESCSCKLF